MVKKANQTWVSPIKETGKWKIQHAGAERASKICGKKAEAIDVGRKISQNQKTEFIVQNKDGQIAFKDSHGNDPHRFGL
ncbi:DUF2188 domain-containing protein [Patescibacteria group bacterium]|nr:DUF2188 domain-containing protein [Patescibacteria group bacterium]MBU1682547.1 DUF2188 domain-containing protein [Patescibacteria group bacterium]MBU1934899.1 DUF2188 domain-containing protein [Patescibacteria group bacterium]